MPLILSIRSNINEVTRDLDRLERQQIPYAQVLAVNALTAMVQKAEKAEIVKTFDEVTPFTLGGVKISRARKSDPTATIFLADVAEQYLGPYISGGRHFLGSKRGILNPKNVRLNRFGNLAKGKLASLKSNENVFVGSIKTKDGKTINGVFQRGNFVKRTKSRTVNGQKIKGITQRHRLKILIRFGDALQVRQHLDWNGVARMVLDANATTQMDLAMKQALATARP